MDYLTEATYAFDIFVEGSLRCAVCYLYFGYVSLDTFTYLVRIRKYGRWLWTMPLLLLLSIVGFFALTTDAYLETGLLSNHVLYVHQKP